MRSTWMVLLALSACDPEIADTFTDVDGDGYSDAVDCDDDDATVGSALTWFADADDDGFRDPATSTVACDPPAGHLGVTAPVDCDDSDVDATVVKAWHLDADSDGFGSPDVELLLCARPAHAVEDASDCDDLNPSTYPGATEQCDGADNDCDGTIDEEVVTESWFPDRDGDGFGDRSATALEACVTIPGMVADGSDCNDAVEQVNPDAEEVCDGIDNDCNDRVDELDSCSASWWALDVQIDDAEFDRVNDTVVAISNADKALYIIDPAARTIETVSLPTAPMRVSVDLAGGEAVVAYDGSVSWVDLTGASVIDTMPTYTGPPSDIVLNDGMAYLIPNVGQWVEITSLDLTSGEATHVRSVREDTLFKMHPGGDRMYGANNGLSPSDFERYDIDSDGIAKESYDSPYHGDYAFSGNIWISDDGSRLFARSGNVFRATNLRETDMTYSGSLGAGTDWRAPGYVWVDTCSADDRVYAVRGDELSQVRAYDLKLLDPKGTWDAPAHDGTDLELGWLFADSVGDHLHLLGRKPSAVTWMLLDVDPATLP